MGDATCSLDNCNLQPHANGRGRCSKHYMQGLRDGTVPRRRRVAAVCIVDGCDRPGKAKDLCVKHYTRWQTHGDVNRNDKFLTESQCEARFWAKVDKRGPDDCWPWRGLLSEQKYGDFRFGKHGHIRAHRKSYELLVGPIPDGMTIDHLCHTRDLSCPGGKACLHRRCVNPAHLEPVPSPENTQRGASRRTHCRRKHPFDQDNTLFTKGARVCRKCRDMRRATYKRRLREREAAMRS